MSIFIIRINKPSLRTLSPQERSHLHPRTIIMFGWAAGDKSESAAGEVKLWSQTADHPQRTVLGTATSASTSSTVGDVKTS